MKHNPAADNLKERPHLLAELKRRVAAGEVPKMYWSGVMYMSNDHIRKVLQGQRNPIAESVLAGLGFGAGLQIARKVFSNPAAKSLGIYENVAHGQRVEIYRNMAWGVRVLMLRGNWNKEGIWLNIRDLRADLKAYGFKKVG